MLGNGDWDLYFSGKISHAGQRRVLSITLVGEHRDHLLCSTTTGRCGTATLPLWEDAAFLSTRERAVKAGYPFPFLYFCVLGNGGVFSTHVTPDTFGLAARLTRQIGNYTAKRQT
jgi:hypothetical protein